MASVKKNKNNPNNKGGNIKQNKLRDSAYCEKCIEVGECKKFKDYEYRMNILHKCGHGISCSK